MPTRVTSTRTSRTPSPLPARASRCRPPSGPTYALAPAGAWFPPFVETAIAASIVYMALENIVGVDLRRRWLTTSLFGLVHGFGFSYALRENLQFAGRHRVVSLLAFNIGIELGQMAVL